PTIAEQTMRAAAAAPPAPRSSSLSPTTRQSALLARQTRMTLPPLPALPQSLLSLPSAPSSSIATAKAAADSDDFVAVGARSTVAAEVERRRARSRAASAVHPRAVAAEQKARQDAARGAHEAPTTHVARSSCVVPRVPMLLLLPLLLR